MSRPMYATKKFTSMIMSRAALKLRIRMSRVLFSSMLKNMTVRCEPLSGR